MKETPNLLLKLPDPTDYVLVEDLNENFIKLDTEIAKITDEETGVEAKLTKHLDDTMQLSKYKSNVDAEGIFTLVEYRRFDGTLAVKSILSGGVSPDYTTRTEIFYDSGGNNVRNTNRYTLSYDADGNVISEVLSP